MWNRVLQAIFGKHNNKEEEIKTDKEIKEGKWFEELSKDKKGELEELFENYSTNLQSIYSFIKANDLDDVEIWDLANQRYDDDMSYAPNDEEE